MNKIFILLLSFALFGCSVSHMKTVYNKPVVTLQDNQSAIIFIRPDGFRAGAISSPIAEYKDGDATFIGNMKGACKILHITTPGKHEYVISGENSYVLKADLKGGMYYYVYITPRFGFMMARFIFEPFGVMYGKNDKNKLTNDINSSSIPWIENTNDGLDWFEDNKPSFISKYKRAVNANSISSLSKDAGTNILIK